MKFTEITFHQLFPIAEFANQRLETKISLEVGEDPIEAFVEAKKMVGEAFKKINMQTLTDGATVTWKHDPMDIPIVSSQVIHDLQKEKSEIAIENATTKEELEKQKSNAEKYGLMELWNEKNNSLK